MKKDFQSPLDSSLPKNIGDGGLSPQQREKISQEDLEKIRKEMQDAIDASTDKKSNGIKKRRDALMGFLGSGHLIRAQADHARNILRDMQMTDEESDEHDKRWAF